MKQIYNIKGTVYYGALKFHEYNMRTERTNMQLWKNLNIKEKS